jgi:hypothetical protein
MGIKGRYAKDYEETKFYGELKRRNFEIKRRGIMIAEYKTVWIFKKLHCEDLAGS